MDLNKEPIVTVAMVTGIGSALVACLVAFGLPLNNNQQGAVLGLLAVVAPLVVILARKWAYAPRTVARIRRELADKSVVSRRAESHALMDPLPQPQPVKDLMDLPRNPNLGGQA